MTCVQSFTSVVILFQNRHELSYMQLKQKDETINDSLKFKWCSYICRYLNNDLISMNKTQYAMLPYTDMQQF